MSSGYAQNLKSMSQTTNWRRVKFSGKSFPCQFCGASFSRVPGDKDQRVKFCSSACRQSAEAAKRKRTDGPGKGWSAGKRFAARLVCQNCQGEFYAPPRQVKRGGGKYCSVACRAAVFSRQPGRFPQTKGRRGRGGRREDLGGKYFRSSWEANWARYLDWLKEKKQIRGWEFESETFEFVGIKRGTRFYTPDFKVENMDGSIERHEIKGYMDQRSATKLKRMEKYHPDVKITVIGQKEYSAVASTMKALIPAWEVRR
jgi:hypothetical protein